MIKLSQECLKILKGSKNLLAFSHGTDSTALFYLLCEHGVEFDLAMVDYNLRAQSKDEVASAMALAREYGKEIYTRSVLLEDGNFESRARQVRYEFFAKICAEHIYKNVILAHQLDDKFEWFLMQLGRGAGLNELLGMSECEQREQFCLVRPLLKVSKAEILKYLQNSKIKHFLDASNSDEKYARNFMRANFSEAFLAKFGTGVAKSFELLDADKRRLEPKVAHLGDMVYIVQNDQNAMRGVDRVAKMLGVLLSGAQRAECERCMLAKTDCVLAGRVAVGYGDDMLVITPFLKVKMDKAFKEQCRKGKIPPINRGYLYKKRDLSQFFVFRK
ncbi:MULTISPECIES: tRNA lysidine(34) synthetase TilS [unclassified Campylobacter]|uniref:tRNA lysidine(34) synthetase TilS n=1 Tax=unclassified Campylobacter TaxID=2593542 RepID=UPI003D358DA7